MRPGICWEKASLRKDVGSHPLCQIRWPFDDVHERHRGFFQRSQSWEASPKLAKIESWRVFMSVTVGPRVPRRSPMSAEFSDHQIRQIAQGNSQAIAQWVESTAKRRGIFVQRMARDKFVKAVSRLSDGVVDLDEVEELLIALGRAGVITSFQRGLLQVHYLR